MRVDHKCVARSVLIFSTRSSPVSHAHSTRGVTQERKGKSEFLSKCAIILDRVERNATHRDIAVDKVLDSITESLALLRSSRSVSFGIEPEHKALTSELAERALLALVIKYAKVWRSSSYLNHLGSSAKDAAEKGTEHGGDHHCGPTFSNLTKRWTQVALRTITARSLQ